MGADGQDRVEQEDSLPGPFEQIAVVRDIAAQIIVELPVDVDQGGRGRAAGPDREAHAVGLALAVIGVLAQDHDPDLSQRGLMQGAEEVLGRGIDGPGPVLLLDKGE